MNDEKKEIKINTLGQLLDFVETEEKAKLLIDHITNLQQENEYFNKKNIELSTLNTSLRSDRDDYKSRIEKAVEYINTHYLNANEPELLDILNGRSDE